MSYKVIISDIAGHIVSSTIIEANNLLIAGIMAEDILDQYHQEHPCKHCTHNCRVDFNRMKGDV